jgi:hypothetical protein
MLAGLVAVPTAAAQGGPAGVSGGGGDGGGGRAAQCVIVSFDPVTLTDFVVCSTNRA